jgi:PTS system mannose-specific IIB component
MARIDNRLIHGQIVEGWLPAIDINNVVVVSQQYSSSSFAQKMMRIALPSRYGLNIFDGFSAAQYLKKENSLKEFILIENFLELKSLLDNGVVFKVLNIGNTSYENGKKEFAQGIYLSSEEIDLLKEISSKNVKIDARLLPASIPSRII